MENFANSKKNKNMEIVSLYFHVYAWKFYFYCSIVKLKSSINQRLKIITYFHIVIISMHQNQDMTKFLHFSLKFSIEIEILISFVI